jgi:hypothetical protein
LNAERISDKVEKEEERNVFETKNAQREEGSETQGNTGTTTGKESTNNRRGW